MQGMYVSNVGSEMVNTWAVQNYIIKFCYHVQDLDLVDSLGLVEQHRQVYPDLAVFQFQLERRLVWWFGGLAVGESELSDRLVWWFGGLAVGDSELSDRLVQAWIESLGSTGILVEFWY